MVASQGGSFGNGMGAINQGYTDMREGRNIRGLLVFD